MRDLRALFIVAIVPGAIFAAVTVGGCGPIVPGVDSGTPPPADAQTTETIACVIDNGTCTASTVCCTMGFVCGVASSTCVAPCLAIGELCTDNGNCCSGLCDGTCD